MIDLTPLDVRNKRGDFKKILRGYDPQEVDTFLELVADRLEDLVREVMHLRERAESLDQQVTSQSGRASIKETGLKTFHTHLQQIDSMLSGRQWFGDSYSVLDPYGLVFYTWGVRRELPMGELKNYTAFKDRMLQRPAVAKVLAEEKIKV